MLGSAIPKRWVVSLALVGLVSLLMFSDAALSSERASAQDGVGVTLTSVTSPTTVSFPAGTVVGVTTEVKDENGYANATLANDNYAWAVTGGCGSVTASTTVPQTTFTAGSSACTGTITVNAYQDTATTSTVRDMEAITLAGTSAADRTNAVGVTTNAAVTNDINDAANYTDAATALTMTSTTGIVAGEYIKIGTEIIKITTVTNGTVLGEVVRGVHGTTPAAILDDVVVQEVTVGSAINDAAGITAAATSITVDSSTTFAADEYAKIGTEIVKITAAPTVTTLTVVRAQFGTTAATAADDAEVIEVTVTGTLTAADTTLAVADGSVFAANDYVVIGSEVLKVSVVATNVLTVSRGEFGTTDATHAADATITKQVTKSGSTAVSVVAAAAVAATPAPTDPSPVPSIVPDGLTADDVSVILPSSGGSFTEVDGTASITVPSSAVASGTAVAVNIVSVSSSDVPSPPAAATEGASSGTFTLGSSIINVRWYDSASAELATYSLSKAAEVCVPFTDADTAGAAGGPDGLALWRHNETDWVELNSSVNISAGTVCANTQNFSYIALGLEVAAPGAAAAAGGGEVELPSTGGYTPGIGALMLAMVAGVALVATGVFTLHRGRRGRQHSQ